MITIRRMQVTDSFKYLWLKGVNDVDLSQHCARCLIGQYSKVISKDKEVLVNVDIDVPKSSAYYLCGVTEPFRYRDNFHLAFKEKQGEMLTINRNGIELEMENAAEIPFSIKDVDKSLREASDRYFITCRNWQFANKFKKGI
jgi:hypothetical protein